MKLITVGLPVYNAMPYLPETIQSLLHQTYRNFELFVIDDGSTDGSLEYLRSIRDRRLKLISQENQGLTVTLNRMLRDASTPWLVRHDADDIAFPERLSLIAEHIRRFPDAGMFYSYARYYHDGRAFGHFRSTCAHPLELRDLTLRGHLLAICHPSVTLNVARTIQVGGYRFDLHIEDVDLWWRMALAADIHLIPYATVACRHNARSVSMNNFERQCLHTLFVQYLLLSHVWNLTPFPLEVVSERLQILLDSRRMRFRKHARLSGICLSEKRVVDALKHACTAVYASPAHFTGRLLYEVWPKGPVINGEDPGRFVDLKQLLWPEVSSTSQASLLPYPDVQGESN